MAIRACRIAIAAGNFVAIGGSAAVGKSAAVGSVRNNAFFADAFAVL